MTPDSEHLDHPSVDWLPSQQHSIHLENGRPFLVPSDDREDREIVEDILLDGGVTPTAMPEIADQIEQAMEERIRRKSITMAAECVGRMFESMPADSAASAAIRHHVLGDGVRDGARRAGVSHTAVEEQASKFAARLGI